MPTPLTSLAQLKAFLNFKDTTKDGWLTALQTAAEDEVRTYCGQNFDQRTYVEYADGTGQRELVLRQRPIYSVSSVYFDDNGNFGDPPPLPNEPPFQPATLLTPGVDYAIRWDGTDLQGVKTSPSAVLYRLNTIWAEIGRTYTPGKLYAELGPNFGSLKITYTAGYAANAIPSDLQYAICLLCSYYMLTVRLAGFPLESERIGDYMYRLHFPMRPNEFTHPELGSIRAILSKYRDVAI